MPQSMSYQRLEVYQRAHRIAVALHAFSLKLPAYELYESGSQLRRASKSISANIVEGYGRRRYKADFIRFLTYAHASWDEAMEWVRYVQDCHKNLGPAAASFTTDLDELGRMLNRFLQSVKRRHRSEP